MTKNEKIDERKLRIFLIRNNNLVTFFKLFIILVLIFTINLNKKFILYVFYLLIIDLFMLNQKQQRFHKYLVNITIFTMLLVDRLLYCSSNFTVIDVMISIIYIFVILMAIKVDLIANRVKYNFTLWDEELKNIIKKYKILTFIKVLVITSMLLLVKVNILIVVIIGLFNLFQLFLGNSETDKMKRNIADLLIFYISALSILFKSNYNSIINSDMGVILGLLVVIVVFWIIENKKN